MEMIAIMDTCMPTMMIAATLLILFGFIVVHRRRCWKPRTTRIKMNDARLPRGSLGWPLVGETLEFVSCAYSPRPESFMDKRRLMYGKVFKSHILGSPTIVSTDAEVSKYVLQSDAKTFVPSYPKSLTELMGNSSILLINGNLQRRVHGLMGSFFKSPLLKSQVTSDMERLVTNLIDTWRHDDQRVFIQAEAKQIVFQILVRVLIGLEPGEEMQLLKHEFQEYIAGLISLPVKIPGSRLYRSLRAKKRMVNLVGKKIKEKREAGMDRRSPPQDVIDVLLNDGSSELDDELISDNMIDLMIPGEDSVPILITLAVKYLSDSPLALHQLREENMKINEEKRLLGEDMQWGDYLSLSFTQDVITETLRLGNIISGIMRKAMRDVEIKGHFIPKGWCVFTYFRSVHLDASNYDHPCNFNPWRWKNKEVSACNFSPFGGGQRLCPGIDIARLEASIFLHQLITGFTWVAEEDDVVNFPTVRMRKGMPIRVTRRRADVP